MNWWREIPKRFSAGVLGLDQHWILRVDAWKLLVDRGK